MRLALVLLMMLLASAAPLAIGSHPECVPDAFPERVALDGIGLRIGAADAATFYVVTHGARTLGQSNVELWEETNAHEGLQMSAGCGAPADRLVAGACAFRSGAVGALECPAVWTGQLF